LAIGDIIGLLFAGGFVLLVIFLGLPLIKLAKVVDETTVTVKLINQELKPMLQEVNVSIAELNKQLKRVDSITEDVEQVTENVNSLVAVLTAGVGGPLAKLVGITKGFGKGIFKGSGK